MAKGVCYFCGEERILTQEHYFPKWSRQYVPIGKNVTANNFSNGKKVKRDVGTVTFQRVCRDCNGIWMSKIQERAKPHLAPLLTSEHWASITSEAANAISVWSVMTAMVCAGANRPDFAEIDPVERREFSVSQQISPDWQIWIGRSPHAPNRGVSPFHLICRDGHEVNGVRKLWKVDGFLIGHIFIMLIGKLIVLAWSGSQQILNIEPLPHWGMIQIWPSLGTTSNPPGGAFPTHYNPRVLKDVLEGNLSDPNAAIAWPYGVTPMHPDSGALNVPHC